MSKIIITGGGGFLGRFVARQLKAAGHDITVLGRHKYDFMEKEGFRCVQADICDSASMNSAFQGFDEVHHVASMTGISVIRDPFYRINVTGTENVIQACRINNIKKLVYTSSPSVVYCGDSSVPIDESASYPSEFLSHYPETKAIAEKMVLQANEPGRLLTIALRPHLIWGPEDTNLIPRLLKKARSGRLRIVGTGKNQVDVTYVENAALAHLLASEKLVENSPVCGKAYFITNDKPVYLWDFINEILMQAGIPRITRKISFQAANLAGRFLESFYSMFSISAEPPMTRFLASQLATSHIYSCDNARKDLGYIPQISVEEGLLRLSHFLNTSSICNLK